MKISNIFVATLSTQCRALFSLTFCTKNLSTKLLLQLGMQVSSDFFTIIWYLVI